MHASISINSLCILAGSLGVHVDMIARLGAGAISPMLEEVEEIGAPAATRLIRDAGLKAATFTHRAFGYAMTGEATAQCERLNRSIDLAAAIGAQSVTLTTGGRGMLTWADAAKQFAEAIQPSAAHARAAGVALSVEPTSHLYADTSIAHRLADLTALCRRADIGLGIDLFACWFDSDIEEAIAAAIPLCKVVQVSDYVAGDRGLPCRAVPGDGMVPLDRLIPAILDAGYTGYFDLEIIGPRIVAEGQAAALARAGQRLGAILDHKSVTKE